jgi:hypothetical protein
MGIASAVCRRIRLERMSTELVGNRYFVILIGYETVRNLGESSRHDAASNPRKP